MAALKNTSSGQMIWVSGIKGSKDNFFFSLRVSAISHRGMVRTLVTGTTDIVPGTRT